MIGSVLSIRDGSQLEMAVTMKIILMKCIFVHTVIKYTYNNNKYQIRYPIFLFNKLQIMNKNVKLLKH